LELNRSKKIQETVETTGCSNKCLCTVQKLKAIVSGHNISICCESIGQIKNRSRMATIHQASHSDAASQRLYKDFVDIIISNLSTALKIDRDQSFIVTIFFITILITYTTSMTLTTNTVGN
jgi:hypothetical protein